MPVKIECPECKKKLNVKDELAGKRVKCPICAASIPVPGRPAQKESIAAGDAPVKPVTVVPKKSVPTNVTPIVPAKPDLKSEAPDNPEALAELKEAAKAFMSPLETARITFGCASILLILIAIGASIGIASAYEFGWACLFGPALLILILGGLVAINNVREGSLKATAADAVAQIEERHDLTHQQAFDLLCTDKDVVAIGEFGEFTLAAWGDKITDKLAIAEEAKHAEKDKQETAKAGDNTASTEWACGECGASLVVQKAGHGFTCSGCSAWLYVPSMMPCPKCDSNNTLFSEGSNFSWTGAIVGGLLFGALGAAIGANAGTKIGSFGCNACQHTWCLRLKKVRPPKDKK
jgi:hypothetical protein